MRRSTLDRDRDRDRIDRPAPRKRASASVSRIAALVALAAVAAPASPHVAWPTAYSHKLDVRVDGDLLTISYTVEIPVGELIVQFNAFYADLDLVAEIEKGRIEELEERFRLSRLETLIDELTLTIDGGVLDRPFHPVDTLINGRATEGFFVYLWELQTPRRVPLDRRTEVVVHNGLFQGGEAVFANLVRVRGPLELLEVSTPQPPPDADLEIGSPEEAAIWSTDPARRELRAVLAPRAR